MLLCLSGPISNQYNQQQPFGTAAGVTSELWNGLLSFPGLSAASLARGRTSANLLSIVRQPTGTHMNPLARYCCSTSFGVDHTYLNTLSLWPHYHMYCGEVPTKLGGPCWVHFSGRFKSRGIWPCRQLLFLGLSLAPPTLANTSAPKRKQSPRNRLPVCLR